MRMLSSSHVTIFTILTCVPESPLQLLAVLFSLLLWLVDCELTELLEVS